MKEEHNIRKKFIREYFDTEHERCITSLQEELDNLREMLNNAPRKPKETDAVRIINCRPNRSI